MDTLRRRRRVGSRSDQGRCRMENAAVARAEILVPDATAPAAAPILLRPAARLWGAARALTRHLDEPASPGRTRLAAEVDRAADALASALGGHEVPADEIDQMLLLRCACL